MHNLGNALRILGERESGIARLEEAAAAYRAAIEVFEPAKADYYLGGTQQNLRRTEALIASRRSQGS
jgi:hypothetical protein